MYGSMNEHSNYIDSIIIIQLPCMQKGLNNIVHKYIILSDTLQTIINLTCFIN